MSKIPIRETLNILLSDSEGLYEVTQLKREPKDFSLGEIKREIHRGEQIHNLYRLAEKLLPHLLISNESIKYYASLVTYYSVFRLKRFDQPLVYLYLLCFVYHRYQRLHDNLINSLIHNVRQYMEAFEHVLGRYAKSNARLRLSVFDILFNNTTDVQPEVHSTDTHGTNEVNFAILHLFGYQFAPRYKDIHDTVSKSLYGFKHPSQYGDLLIKPIRRINENLIISECKLQRTTSS